MSAGQILTQVPAPSIARPAGLGSALSHIPFITLPAISNSIPLSVSDSPGAAVSTLGWPMPLHVSPQFGFCAEPYATDGTYGLAAVPGEVLAQPRLTAQSQSAAPDRTEEHPGVRVRQR